MSSTDIRQGKSNPAHQVWLLATPQTGGSMMHELHAGGCAVEVFSSIDDLLLAAREGPVTAVVLAIAKATTSLSTTVGTLTRRFSGVPVIVSCATIDGWEVRTALAAGAAGVVCEQDLHATLMPCLRAACSGQVCVPRPYWRQTDRPALSSRERQVLRLVAEGHMNSEIAKRLFLAESTIKSHLSSAFGKLGVHSRNAAAELIMNSESTVASHTPATDASGATGLTSEHTRVMVGRS